jgi:hypothetical protein
MPSYTPASALVKFYEFDGFPWNMPAWQQLTGIKHGLFPPNDSHLPPGWTRRNADDVKSYFNKYQQQPSDNLKIKFASSRDPSSPGRKFWAEFVSKSWPKWDIHSKIIEGLKKCSIHPVTLLENEGTLDYWPNSDLYIPIALDTIALQLFGPEAFGDSDVLPINLRRCLTIFVQRSWSRIRVQVTKDKEKLPKIESEALSTFESMLHYVYIMFSTSRVDV